MMIASPAHAPDMIMLSWWKVNPPTIVFLASTTISRSGKSKNKEIRTFTQRMLGTSIVLVRWAMMKHAHGYEYCIAQRCCLSWLSRKKIEIQHLLIQVVRWAVRLVGQDCMISMKQISPKPMCRMHRQQVTPVNLWALHSFGSLIVSTECRKPISSYRCQKMSELMGDFSPWWEKSSQSMAGFWW